MNPLPHIPRSTIDRRSGWDRRNCTLAEKTCIQNARYAGVQFQGLQPGIPEKGIETQMLFCRPEPNSPTLALPLSKVTPLALLAKLSLAERETRKGRPFQMWFGRKPTAIETAAAITKTRLG